jgi:hypothetical protein
MMLAAFAIRRGDSWYRTGYEYLKRFFTPPLNDWRFHQHQFDLCLSPNVDQPNRFEWRYNPDALKQQDRWQKSSAGELKSLKQALGTSELMLDEIDLAILRQIEAPISLRWSDS